MLMIYLLVAGPLCAGFGAIAIIWSIFKPQKRVWPLTQITPLKLILVWAPTFLGFGAAISLGVLDWNSLGLPAQLRWSIGAPLIGLGHIVVWRGVKTIGLAATSGAKARLKTNGLYKYTRNPQYLADISSLIGWGLLSSSVWALPVITALVIVFALTPFAEEPWLAQTYGARYEDYCAATRRFF